MPQPERSPSISILVPVYNAHKYLAQTLDSVVAQTLTDWELIAVDDGSQDDSAAIVKRYAAQDARIRLVQQTNGGVAAARNQGFAESNPRSAYVIFLDNDDLWEPDTLQILRDALQAHPEYAAAHGQARYIDATGRHYTPHEVQERFAVLDRMLKQRLTVVGSRVFECPETRETTFATLAVANCIVSPGLVLLRRSALPAGTLLDAGVAPCDDWDLYLRIMRHGAFFYVPEAILNYRLHDANASNNKVTMDRSAHSATHKAFLFPDNTPQQRRALMVGMAFREAQEVHHRLDWMNESLRQRQWMQAVKQGRHALHKFSHVKYLRLKTAWQK